MKRRFQLLALLILTAIVVVVVAALIVSQHIPTDDPKVQDNQTGTLNTFPDLVGTNLLFKELHIPADMDLGPRLIVTAYDIQHQAAAYDWLVPLAQLNEEFPQLSGYFVPLLPKSASGSAVIVIGTMAVAIGDDWDRANTIVVFTDVEKFNEMVDVDSKEDIQLFLVDHRSQIVWRASGDFEAAKLANLRAALEALLGHIEQE
ncbi:MAG: hypothetical protein K8S97_15435 [Anaerolineae bacterium]|nr:hypothetical protein [Anaerolineae bacterium]